MFSRNPHTMNKGGWICGKGRMLRFLLLLVGLLLLIYLTNFNNPQFHQLIAQGSGTENREKEHHINKNMDASDSVNSVDKNHRGKCDSSNFQLKHVQAAFQACVTKNEDILLKSYLEGWTELQKFINALGTIFGFISHEVTSKMRVIIQLQQGVHGREYTSMQSMIHYELANNVVNFNEVSSDHLDSGCRTLLRLHRALRWLQLFLNQLRISSENDSMSTICAEAYDQSLGKYHSWFVQKAARIAFHALPQRTDFLHILCMEDSKETKDKLRNSVSVIERVYNITQHTYEQYNMLELP
ncbi:ceramide-1-phosphate transfer protein-like [Carcharodon carcharias]|uniref:ceramide-1-phosphate transfer protein-like n=1 Tax=Carcharodon carcharias TaxID=13397 RepID=UPI001B7E26C5|nr:ceramide-1-phosphate transfer protein-like [Carcharodon carcharias]